MTKREKEPNLEIEDISISNFEKAVFKSHYPQFARYCYWLLLKYSEGEEVFYVRDLSKWAKISHSNAYLFFEGLVDLGYVKSNLVGHFKHYSLINNSNTPKLKELLPYIIKTLKKLKIKK